MPELTQIPAIREVLVRSRTVAVLGAHDETARAAHYVPAYLDANGYEVFAVNPGKTAQTLWDRPVAATLAELGTPIDVVDVFRPGPAILGHLPDILAMSPLPRVVWFQLGVRNDVAAAALVGAGIDVVQDRCMKADHRRWFAPDTSQRAGLVADDLERYRKRLLEKGTAVAGQLADLLAGKDVRMGEIQGVKGLGGRHKAEDRLRAFLDHLSSQRAALEAGDPAFGRCDTCGQAMTVAELDEMPWATQCAGCGS
jgi:uncharacterized protein